MQDDFLFKYIGGPLSNPADPVDTMARLSNALRHVIEATGYKGELALQEACAMYEAADRAKGVCRPVLTDAQVEHLKEQAEATMRDAKKNFARDRRLQRAAWLMQRLAWLIWGGVLSDLLQRGFVWWFGR